jgi:hypothetical protein
MSCRFAQTLRPPAQPAMPASFRKLDAVAVLMARLLPAPPLAEAGHRP